MLGLYVDLFILAVGEGSGAPLSRGVRLTGNLGTGQRNHRWKTTGEHRGSGDGDATSDGILDSDGGRC